MRIIKKALKLKEENTIITIRKKFWNNSLIMLKSTRKKKVNMIGNVIKTIEMRFVKGFLNIKKHPLGGQVFLFKTINGQIKGIIGVNAL